MGINIPAKIVAAPGYIVLLRIGTTKLTARPYQPVTLQPRFTEAELNQCAALIEGLESGSLIPYAGEELPANPHAGNEIPVLKDAAKVNNTATVSISETKTGAKYVEVNVPNEINKKARENTKLAKAAERAKRKAVEEEEIIESRAPITDPLQGRKLDGLRGAQKFAEEQAKARNI